MSKNKVKITRAEIAELNNVMSQVLLKGLDSGVFMPWLKEKTKLSDLAKVGQTMAADVMNEFGVQQGVELSPEVIGQIQPRIELINKDVVEVEFAKILSENDLAKLIENNSSLNSSALELIYKHYVKS